MGNFAVLFFLSAFLLAAEDCPRFPEVERHQVLDAAALDLAASQFAKRPHQRTAIALQRANFIDAELFAKMEADGVAAAPLASDVEFLRRVTLDLTGRIPAPERVETFLNSSAATRRADAIEELLASPAFTTQLAYYFLKRFEVTSAPAASNVSYDLRNRFAEYIQTFIARDRSYQDLVAELLAVTGNSNENVSTAFLLKGWDRNLPVQDNWDNLTDRVTTNFLGYKTECISCHDGRRHLEQINLGLVRRRRTEFFSLASFWSRMQVTLNRNDVQSRLVRFFISDRPEGFYDGTIDPNNPGPRPTRIGGPWEPRYLTSGAAPGSENFRQDFARLLTNDRQFARATVNYLWAYFFKHGIVDPPANWDLARQDPNSPPPAPWAVQNSHPKLLEQLTDFFIENGYRIRPLARLIVSSTSYQLSSRYPEPWRPELTRYFARFHPRRLSAEQLYDSLITATQTERPLDVRGWNRTVLYANELPDAAEPDSDTRVREMLTLFGRGDWQTTPPTAEPSLLQQLYFMNHDQTVLATHYSDGSAAWNRVLRVHSEAAGDADAIRRMFLATLSRPPAQSETDAVLAQRANRARLEWLSDLQWALLNKSDFWFNY